LTGGSSRRPPGLGSPGLDAAAGRDVVEVALIGDQVRRNGLEDLGARSRPGVVDITSPRRTMTPSVSVSAHAAAFRSVAKNFMQVRCHGMARCGV
jgi:hypothetical protein